MMTNSIAHNRFTLGLLAAAAVAACAGNPPPDEAAATDTTRATPAVMAAPAPVPDSARRDTAMPPPPDTAAATAAAGAVTAQMKGTAGRDLGTLTLTESSGGINVSGHLTGLPPGEHGFHLHTTGKCDGPSFETAGAHWNPTNKGHGTGNPAGPHLGDMPNITVGSDSTVDVQVTTPGGTLHGENALLDGDGAAIVIHASADDYKSNPSGNSGGRIACGVVQGS